MEYCKAIFGGHIQSIVCVCHYWTIYILDWGDDALNSNKSFGFPPNLNAITCFMHNFTTLCISMKNRSKRPADAVPCCRCGGRMV